jgi:5-methylcytosine-specific restriction endonuclease McrA
MSGFKKVVEQAAQQAAIDASPAPCECLRTEVRERTIRGGSKQYVRQCLDCGEPVGNPVKQVAGVALFDEELKRRDTKRRADIREAARKAKSAEWWAFYEEYMASNEWRSLRRKVLTRDSGTCQGCLTESAAEVHHKTYENFGSEFAFELVSLCRKCHERFHD